VFKSTFQLINSLTDKKSDYLAGRLCNAGKHSITERGNYSLVNFPVIRPGFPSKLVVIVAEKTPFYRIFGIKAASC
jgi:hypothetical protein